MSGWCFITVPLRRAMLALPSTFLFLSFTLFTGCRSGISPSGAQTPAPQAVQLPPLQSPSGQTYGRARVGSADHDEPVAVATPNAAGVQQSADAYRGTARKAAKLSIALGPLRTFSDLGAVLDSLPSDAQMRMLNINAGANSARVPEEDKQVTVTAFLYAASHEDDNDFHCIVGRNPKLPARYMNVEVSGLPPVSSQFFPFLQKPRTQFKTFFTSNGNELPTSSYERYTPPIPIKVTGSLFFDVDHVPPAVGPTGLKPKTAWEIHPVTDIQFEPTIP